MLRVAIEGRMRTTAMVMLIIVAAILLNFVLGMVGLTQALARFIASLGLSPLETLLAVGELGRTACRDSEGKYVYISGVADSLKQKPIAAHKQGKTILSTV